MFDRRVISLPFCSVFVLGMLTWFPGCGPGDRVEVHPTKGVVLFEGEPMMGGGSIAFVPLNGQAGKAAGGTIDEEGRFTMSTYEPDDGSMAGEFRAVIMQSTVDEIEYEGDTDVAGAVADASEEFTETVPTDKRIPIEYADSARSPLTVEVKADEQNELTLELTK